MKYVPQSVTRLAGRSLLKLSGASPTILVVGGVVGLGATAVMAARATRNLDPVLDFHAKERVHIEELPLTKKEHQREVVKLYGTTALELGKIYAPTLLVGGVSAACVLGGHKILRGRHIATMAAYSGLMEQMKAYRGRVARTLGAEVEQAIFDGGHGEWVEDPEHKGEYKLETKFDQTGTAEYLRPWFDESSPNWKPHAQTNYGFLKGTQQHLNNMLQIRGHVFLNEVYDDLRIPRTSEGAVMGWLRDSKDGDNLIDFGLVGSHVSDPNTLAFTRGETTRVQLHFNVDEVPIWDKISRQR